MTTRRSPGGDKVRPTQNLLATTPFFEHLEQEFGRQVLSAQTCASYEPASPTERWYCARVHHNMEYVAVVHLRKLQVPVHIALIAQRTNRNPSKAGGVKLGTQVLRRCFPGYLFVALDLHSDSWPAVKQARGFSSLVTRASGEPLAMPWLAMFEVMEQSARQLDKIKRARSQSERAAVERAAAAVEPVRRKVFTNMSDLSDDDRNALLMRVIRQPPKQAEAA